MAIALAVVSGVLGAISAIQQANAQAAAATFNAKVAEQRAAREEEAGKVEAEDTRRMSSRARATQIAFMAASGIEVSDPAGTPLLINEATFREQELTANRRQFARMIGAERLTQEAALKRMEASSFKTAGIIGAGTSLLGGFRQAFSIAGQAAT